jgi:hypothetical protein
MRAGVKKVFCLIFLVVISGSVCAELTANPESFEMTDSIPAGWSIWGSGSGSGGWYGVNDIGYASIESGDAYDGNRYFQMGVSHPSLSWGYMQAEASNNPVVQRRGYELSVAIRDAGGVGNVGLIMRWYGGYGQVLLLGENRVNIFSTSNWQLYTLSAVAPAGANYMSILLVSDGPGSAADYDLISLTSIIKAINAAPVDGAVIVPLDAVLSWDEVSDVTDARYNVYFGTETGNLPLVSFRRPETSYDLYSAGELAEGTDYFWRVDVYDPNIGGSPVIYPGDEWSFKTLTKPMHCPVSDLNDDCRGNMEDLLLFAQNWVSVYDMVDFVGFCNHWLDGMGPVVISEFSADNSQTIDDEDGDSSDWIELYNPTSETVSLDGWKLVDGLNQWTFPGGVTIGPDEYKVIFASGKNRFTDPNLHTNFKLDSNGEYFGLVKDDGVTVVQSFDPNYPKQQMDVSYGLYDDKLRFFTTPTPGAANDDETYLGLVKDTKFNIKRGFYDTPLTVQITCNTPGATIYYTTDGSVPTLTSTRYMSPLYIDTTTILRARAFKDGWLETNTDTQSYIFGASDAVKSLPVISIVGDAGEALYEPNGVMAIVGGTYDGNGFWQPQNEGDFNNPMQRGRAYEREVSVELMNSSGLPGFTINCGLRVQGSNYHRPHYTRVSCSLEAITVTAGWTIRCSRVHSMILMIVSFFAADIMI